MQNYNTNSPIFKLLELGDPDDIKDESIYFGLGITVEHLPELSRMAVDRDLLDSGEDYHWAGPIHAWRVLTGLKVPEAIAPLIQAMQELSEEWLDWAGDELPTLLGRFGSAALPALSTCMVVPKQSNYSMENTVTAIGEVYKQYPENRADCIAVLTRQLEKFVENDPDWNAIIITGLVTVFNSIESAPLMEQAFQAGYVNEDWMGDWDEIQVELGLKDRSEVPVKPFRSLIENPWEFMKADKADPIGFVRSGCKVPKTKAKAKRQTQNASRKKNRVKKK